MKNLRALKLFTFVMLGLGIVLFADLGQALGETFLVPRENRMHALVNETRNGNGLRALPNDDGLRWMARRQASAMSAKGYIYHNPSLAGDADDASLPWVALGENVGKGPSVEAIQKAFVVSPTHVANIVNPDFNALGVGGTTDPDSILYFAQAFAGLQATPATPEEPAPAPATEPPPPPTAPPDSPTEVQGASPTAEPTAEPTTEPSPSAQQTDTAEGDPTERLGFLELIVGLVGKFFGKVTFWG